MTRPLWPLVIIFTSPSFAFVPKLQPQQQRSLPPSTTARMAKHLHRASYERQLEELMDNDWRVFRAKLVAQERVQRLASGKTDPTKDQRETQHEEDERLRRQKQVTDFFGGIIAAFFKSEGEKKDSQARNAFDGEFIGGAMPEEIARLLPEGITEDPFLSLEDLPILIPKFKDLDKRRWAHELSHIEPGCVLVANEKLGGVFQHTVVLIVNHSDKHGTEGVVINRPMKDDLLQIASAEDTKLDLSLKLAFGRSTVSYGGPVHTDEFTVLHGIGEVEGSRKLCPGVFIGGSEVLMDEVRMGTLDPRTALFIKGHATWVPGQLSAELSKGVWYLAAASSHMILRYAQPPSENDAEMPREDRLWGDILECMGGKYEQVAKESMKRNDRDKGP